MATEKILIVDDEQPVREYVERTLKHLGYNVVASTGDAETALKILKEEDTALLLADIHMPGKDGMWLLKEIRNLSVDTNIIVITASHNLEDAIASLNLGADRYILKPMRIQEIEHTVKNVMEKRKLLMENKAYQQQLEERVSIRTAELKETLDALSLSQDKIKHGYIETIQRLTAAAEYKDEETGSHLRRIGLYTRLIAEELDLPSGLIEMIFITSPMHDLGKISIPDKILLKHGPLTPVEFEVIKTHTVVGARILQGSDSEFLKISESIALSHHERWNGSGYPYGLKGEAIPLESRILMVADQYDAIRSRRPYKEPVDHMTAYKILTEGDGKSRPEQFDPQVLEVFRKHHEKFNEIYQSIQ